MLWSSLRKIGSQKAMYLTPLVPIFGHFLLFSSLFVPAQGHAGISVAAPGSILGTDTYRLYLIYYGLFALAIGQVGFAWRCPRTIKQYETQEELTEKALEYPSARSVQRTLQAIENLRDYPHWKDSSLRDVRDALASIKKIEMAISYSPDRLRTKSEQNLIHEIWYDYTFILSVLYEKLDVSRLVSRKLIGLAYSLGFILLSLSSLDAFISITLRLFSSK